MIRLLYIQSTFAPYRHMKRNYGKLETIYSNINGESFMIASTRGHVVSNCDVILGCQIVQVKNL